ncbi:hypothetical protein KY358_05720 [Candidatus Woesearchaeota archaeon]|nr:hypothetical protein [Candidatus Woesearchaeota archaeon]
MKIKPSKRPKKRYVVFEVISGKAYTDSTISSIIKKSVLSVQYKDIGLRLLRNKYDASAHKGVFRINNKYARRAIDAINQSGSIRTVGMSGILKKAQERYMNN